MKIINLNKSIINHALKRKIEHFLIDMGRFKDKNNIDFDIDIYLLDDFSITLNENRFDSNLSIGLACYFTGFPVYILESMINCCGVVAIKTKDNLSIEEILIKIKSVKNKKINCSRKNHFLNVYTDKSKNKYIIIHTSFNKIKRGEFNCPGLYPDKEGYFYKKSISYNGKYGKYSILTGNLAKEYEETVKKWDEYSYQKRRNLAKELFPTGEIIFNKSHLTIPKKGLVLLGAYYLENESDVVILTEGPQRRAGILHAKDFHRVNKINGYIAPHGTGIEFHYDEYKLLEGIGYLFRRNENFIMVSSLKDLPFNYKRVADKYHSNLIPLLDGKI